MTPAIYARYSTDLQREESIEDQVRSCQRRADQAGLGPAEVFADAGLSGASMARRPGLDDLRAALAARRVSAVIVESLDRLSRDQADLALLWREVRQAGARLITVEAGEIRDDSGGIMQVGLGAMMGELYRHNLAHKTRRGLEGVVRSGRHAGPPGYGYRLKAGGQPGELEIDAPEAAIVRRICADYAAGLAPRAIARALNVEGVAGPRGAPWRNTTIFGQPRRGNGILWNPLYRGERVWNRNRKVKDPATGRARMVANPEDAWIREPAPHLQILDADLIAAIDARYQGQAQPARGRKPKRPLSGLLRCGACGGSMAIAGGSGGRRYYACSTQRETGACRGVGSVRADLIEARVFEALKTRMLSAEAIRVAVTAYREERARLAKAATAERAPLERRIAALKAKERRLVEAFAEGRLPQSALEAVGEAETERRTLEATLAAMDRASAGDGPAGATALHPNAADAYAAIVRRLESVLAGDVAGDDTDEANTPAIDDRARAEAIEAVRRLITAITVTPNKKSGETGLQVEGDLAALFELSTQTREKKVGAGARTPHYLTPVPVVFAA